MSYTSRISLGARAGLHPVRDPVPPRSRIVPHRTSQGASNVVLSEQANEDDDAPWKFGFQVNER